MSTDQIKMLNLVKEVFQFLNWSYVLYFTRKTQMWSKSAWCLSDSRDLTLRPLLWLPQELPEGQTQRNKGRISSTCPGAAQFKCNLVGLTVKQVPKKTHFNSGKQVFFFKEKLHMVGFGVFYWRKTNTSPFYFPAYHIFRTISVLTSILHLVINSFSLKMLIS